MIVLDEQISNPLLLTAIAKWYPGAVVSIREQRPHGKILDPEIPVYLLQLRQPTLVTINYRHFFGTQFLHQDYCIVCLKLEQRQAPRVSELLRSLLHRPAYRTKALRMGKVISWTENAVTHFEIGAA